MGNIGGLQSGGLNTGGSGGLNSNCDSIIISVDEIADIFGFSKNIDRKHIERAKREVLDIDIAEKICDDYLERAISNSCDFSDLWKKKVWERNGKRYFHKGLNMAVAYLTAWRYLTEKVGTDTPFGFVEKKTEWSENVEEKKRNGLAWQYKKTGEKYLQRVIDFLNDTDYKDYSMYCPKLCVSDNDFQANIIRADE